MSFCRTPYWDNHITWNTDDPDFTDCFEKTVLIWIPAVFLWISAPFRLCLACHKKDSTGRFGVALFWTKMGLTIVLSAVSAAELGHISKQLIDDVEEVTSGSNEFELTKSHRVQYADVMAAAIRLATYALYVCFLYLLHRRGKRSSAILFLFWTLFLISDTIRIRTTIKHTMKYGLADPIEKFQFALSVIEYVAVVFQFILSTVVSSRTDEKTNTKKPSPEQRSTFVSQILFWWFNKLVYHGWKHTFTVHDLWDLGKQLKARTISSQFLKRWDKRTENLSLGWTLLRTFWPSLLYSGFLKLLYNVMLFLLPEILRLLLGFVRNRSQEAWKGYFFAVILLLTSVVQTTSMCHYFHHCNRLGIRLRTALMSAIYRKILRIGQYSDASEKLGQPTNLISADVQRIFDITSYLNQIWEIPLQIGFAMYLLWMTVGPSSMAGLGVMILSIPLEALVAFYSKRMQTRQMAAKDARIKLTDEVFRTIKLLKLYAWDETYEKKILEHRNEELRSLRIIAFLSAFSTFYSIISPFIIALATFATFVLSDSKNVLDSSKTFVALSIFNILKSPMNMLPPTISSIVQALVSKKRLTSALVATEPKSYVEPLNVPFVKAFREHRPAIAVSRGEFAWKNDGPPCLTDISLSIPSGKLIGIVGPAGSGKTALCRAILDLLERRGGTVKTGGTIAYMPQQSWLQSRTFKDNVLFGRPYHRMSYQTTLEECALIDDLNGMPAGEDTVFSDQGSNLSGGQKQRICLARTIYGYADVFIFDDPLSALDAKVSKQVFENILGANGILKEKTRVVVINGYQFLPQFDQLIVMDDGQITEIGNFRQLIDQGGTFSDFLNNHLRQEIEALQTSELEEAEAAHRHVAFKEVVRQLPYDMRASLRQHRKSVTSLTNRRRRSSVISKVGSLEDIRKRLQEINSRSSSIYEQDNQHGGPVSARESYAVGLPVTAPGEVMEVRSFNWRVYWGFVRSITVRMFVVILLSNTISTGFSVASNIWLSKWSEDNVTLARSNEQRDFRLGVYAALGGFQGIFFFISMISLAYGLILSSKILHSRMLYHVIRAPTYFFDATPLGRITNRFSKDVDAVDVNVPQGLRQCLNAVFNIFGTATVLIYAYPLFTAIMVPIAIIYIVLLYFYISTSRQLKLMESSSRSPIFSHFQETLSGAGLINLFGQQQRFTDEFESFVNSNNQVAYLSLVAQRWLSLRLEIIGNIIAFLAAILAVYGRDHWNVEPGTVGLTITYAIQVTQVLSWFVQKVSDLEMSFISVERIKEYTECPQEAKSVIPDHRPPADWPTSGSIRFDNYKARYGPELDLALKGLTCEVAAKEKVGIVGRTGAGKSSLSLSIFRVIEATEGSITIDGLDISTIGLLDLRSNITIIPQDPFLLSGSLRENLDPNVVCSDETLWDALDAVNLRRYVMSLKGGLLHQVEEGGANFSGGQRQMLCLARAILRKPRILIMDEATASLDVETDELMQKTIRSQFRDCTVLIIAHRLQSIMDCNRVMVLDKGQIAEFDSPQNLLKNRTGLFYSLAHDANFLEQEQNLSENSADTIPALDYEPASPQNEAEPEVQSVGLTSSSSDDENNVPET